MNDARAVTTTQSSDIIRTLGRYTHLYKLRNSCARLEPSLALEWEAVSSAVDGILSAHSNGNRPVEMRLGAADTEALRRLSLDPLRLPVRIQALCETRRNLYAVTVRNLSTRGAFVEMSAPLSPGERIRLNRTCCQTPFALDGRVVWSNAGRMHKKDLSEGFGIRFEPYDAVSHRRLHRFLSSVIERRLTSFPPER